MGTQPLLLIVKNLRNEQSGGVTLVSFHFYDSKNQHQNKHLTETTDMGFPQRHVLVLFLPPDPLRNGCLASRTRSHCAQ